MQVYTWEEVRKHTTEDSYWLVAHRNVYDVTKYINIHSPIMRNQNRRIADPFRQDVTISYDFHCDKQQVLWKTQLIGKIKADEQNKTCAIQ